MRWGALLLISITSVFSAAQFAQVNLPSSSAASAKASATQGGTVPTTLPPIVITGKMMGYYRLPDRQPLQIKNFSAESPCPLDPETKLSPEAAVFLQQYPRRGDTLLVGTGDNFSPNYFSRAFEDASVAATSKQSGGPLAGKEFFEWDPGTIKAQLPGQWLRYDDSRAQKIPGLREGTATIGTDNVGCFFSYAGYKALVPGPEDFYFGPERLRMLARLMAGIKQSGYSPVQMLGANLAIKSSWATDHKPLPDELKPPLLFLTRYIGPTANYSIKVQNFTAVGGAYPWMRKIKVKFEPAMDDWRKLRHLHPRSCSTKG